jgi:hypothetical protein
VGGGPDGGREAATLLSRQVQLADAGSAEVAETASGSITTCGTQITAGLWFRSQRREAVVLIR